MTSWKRRIKARRSVTSRLWRQCVFPRQAGLYAKAPNPNAGKLFAEWLISDEGQKTIDSIGREIDLAMTSNPRLRSSRPSGRAAKPLPVTDKLFLEDPKKWLDTNVKPIWEG